TAVGFFGIHEVTDQAFDVPIEDDADKVSAAVDNRRTGIAADNVQSGDEIQRRGQIYFVFSLEEARHEIEWRLVVETCRTIVQTIEGGFRRRFRSIHGISLNRPVSQA